MGITSSNKEINRSQIRCGGTFRVTLALSAAPDISENPTDIVLVLDRSGSMAGSPLANLKLGANTFIDIIDESTDSTQDGQIGLGSRIAIVSFSGSATANTQLITSVSDLKSAVNSLSAGGATNHADAFSTAMSLFDPSSSNARVASSCSLMERRLPEFHLPRIAEAIRDSGVVIYCIGLIGDNGIDIDSLNDWATDPDTSHVVFTPDESELEGLCCRSGSQYLKTRSNKYSNRRNIESIFHNFRTSASPPPVLLPPLTLILFNGKSRLLAHPEMKALL